MDGAQPRGASYAGRGGRSDPELHPGYLAPGAGPHLWQLQDWPLPALKVCPTAGDFVYVKLFGPFYFLQGSCIQ